MLRILLTSNYIEVSIFALVVRMGGVLVSSLDLFGTIFLDLGVFLGEARVGVGVHVGHVVAELADWHSTALLAALGPWHVLPLGHCGGRADPRRLVQVVVRRFEVLPAESNHSVLISFEHFDIFSAKITYFQFSRFFGCQKSAHALS